MIEGVFLCFYLLRYSTLSRNDKGDDAMNIKIENLRKEYAKQVVLNDISFQIKAGEICGLVGVNGAGKSTLMKILMGIVPKTSGDVYIDDKKWCREHLDKMGGLIETPPIYGNLSAFDNLKVKALINDIRNDRILEVLNIVGLENTKKRSAKFSMGMKMRLGIALAILNNPKILILDEPTNGLDPVGIKELKGLIKGLSQKGTTILLSSHQLKDVAEISDHIIMIEKGNISYDGACESTEKLERKFFEIINR